MFLTNITTASGIPRPALTSESADINKATMDVLMRNTRAIVKSHQLLISNLFENVIFPRIALSNSIQNHTLIIPKLVFLEDNDTANARIDTVKRKAVALTSLANTYALLLNTTTNGGTANVAGNVKKDSENGIAAKELAATPKTKDKESKSTSKVQEIIAEMEDLLLTTIKDFKFNNDNIPSYIEDYKKASEDSTKNRSVENKASVISRNKTDSIELSLLNNYHTSFSLDADFTEENESKNMIMVNSALIAYKKGYTVIDNKTEKVLDIKDFLEFKSKIKNN